MSVISMYESWFSKFENWMSKQLGKIIFGKPTFAMENMLQGCDCILGKSMRGSVPPRIPAGQIGWARSAYEWKNCTFIAE